MGSALRQLALGTLVAMLVASGARAQTNTDDALTLEGRVIAVEGQILVIDVGRDDGLSVDERIAFSKPGTIDLGTGEVARMERLLAIGDVRAVSSHRARVRLGTNERVAVGTRARRTEGSLTRSLVAPPASDARTEISVGIRLLGTVGASGGGALVNARIDRRLGSHGLLRFRMDPTGIVGYRREDPDRSGPAPRPPASSAATASGVVLLAYDTGPIAMGAGIGVTMTTRLDESYVPCATCSVEVRHHGFEPGLTFATMARFGVRDGLSMEVDTAFVAVRSRIEMSRLAVRLTVPVTPALAFIGTGSGGFGVVGTRIIDIGARMLVHGNGNAHSLFLTPHVGYAAVSERADLTTTPTTQPRPETSVLVHGLSMGLTVESRF